ncbi:hypothetical protein J7K70_02780, partial [bacterium]|nr:hypothetical protein [bacterium]
MQENSQPNYISLKEAAKYSGCYSQDYLRLRARQGKLKAEKIASNWVTKKEWIDEYLERVKRRKEGVSDRREDKKTEDQTEEEKYISLEQAAKFCSYSQAYLSLRARQGKLKATKFGRNWVTTKEWVDEYIKRVEEYKSQISDRKKLAIPGKTQKKPEITKPTLTPFTSTSFLPGCRARVIAVVCALVFIFGSIGLVFGYPYY